MSTDADEPAGDARRRTLVEADELAGLLARGEQVTLLDVRGSITGPPGRPLYEAGHLPGAVFVDLETELSGTPGEGGRHPLPDPAAFQRAMRAAGVDDAVEVVAYDAATSLYAARLWWLLTDAGHPRVRVLDGGFAAWTAAGHPVETGPGGAPVAGGFVARPGRRERVGVEQIVADPQAFTLVDVRAAERYRGEVEPIDPVAGHIPGALNRPAALLLDEDAHVRPAAEVAAEYAGVEAPVLYCGSGITAAQALLALEAAGIEGGRIYPGSWSDWIRDPDRPVATGEEPGDRRA
jgi:thiosulfate/3-mercaptopyruvate sulfurtransferase